MNTDSPASGFILKTLGLFFRPRLVPPIPRTLSRILVVRQHDQLGDMLCVIPTLNALRKAHPQAGITLVASPINYDIMKGHPALADVLLFDKKAVTSSPAGWSKFIGSLRSKRYDIAIVPSTVSISLTSGLIARLSGAPIRIGPGVLEHRDNPAKFLFTHPVELDWSATPARHQASRNADILRPLGIVPEDLTTNVGLTPAEIEEGRRLVEPLRRQCVQVIGIHPGAAKPGNRWPAESFLRLAELLHDRYKGGLLVTIGPKDADIFEFLSTRLKVPHQFIRNEPIRRVASAIASLDLFVSNDTGPLHIAGALPVPVLGLFGPTDPIQWAPPGRKNHHVSAKEGIVASLSPEEVMGVCEVILARPKE